MFKGKRDRAMIAVKPAYRTNNYIRNSYSIAIEIITIIVPRPMNITIQRVHHTMVLRALAACAVTVCTLLTLVSGIPNVSMAQDDVAAALYQEGLKKYILEDYLGALKDFESALKLNPENDKFKKMQLNTLIKQGNREYETGSLAEAEYYFSRAYRLSGEDEELGSILDSIRIKLRRQEEQAAYSVQEQPKLAVEKPPETEETEVQIPFDMEAFIQQQNAENRILLDEMLATQRQEREALLKNIEENRRILNRNLNTQQDEREYLYSNLEEQRKLLDNSIEAGQEERRKLLENIEESREAFSENISEQRRERETLIQSIEENQRIIDESIRNQREERQALLENIAAISRNQSEDRKLFSRTLMILVGGSIFIALIILLGFILLLKRRTIPLDKSVSYEAPPALELKPRALLDYAEGIDESKYITDDRYSDMVQAKQLGHLYGELRNGNLSWNTLQGYISELNHEMKSSILHIVEEKLRSGDVEHSRNAVDILLPFLTDGEGDISSTSQRLFTEIAGNSLQVTGREETDDPMSYNALLQFAHMVDAKTGRLNHSIHVSVLAEKMAAILNDPELEPDSVKLVGLVHDIGYLELDDGLLRKEGKLTERQFNIIKTHTECGLHLLKHVDLPQIFLDGIRFHHERLDGSGYPKGLQKGRIPKIARLLGVADFFDAVTSLRPYRPAHNVDEGIRMVEELSGKALDPEMIRLLEEIYRDKMDDKHD
jgi:putative nucleotidyltransferase with HDIG domain